MYSRGYSFQWEDGNNGEHTWFVLTDSKDEEVIVANITSFERNKPSNDDTCRISHTDMNPRHPRIRNLSFVLYRKAMKITHSKLDEITSDRAVINKKVPAWIVDKMAAGLEKSDATTMRVKNFYKAITTPRKTNG